MRSWFRHPVAIAALIAACGLIAFAAFLMKARQRPPSAVVQSAPVPANAQTLAGLRVSLAVAGDRVGNPTYLVAIEVEGDRTFTMPVRFIRGLKPAAVNPEDARHMLTSWAKARATGIAQFGVISPDAGPTLLIDVDNPGAR